MARQKALKGRVPAVTLFLAGVSLLAYCWPHLSDLLVYDRQAILQGEVWRLFTAPVVHFSLSHLWWDLSVFCAAGWAIEVAGFRGYRLVCSLSAFIPGTVFLLVSPNLARYGGLSGLATGAVVYLSLWESRRPGRSRILWLAILALTGVKIIVESVTGAPIFLSTDNIPLRVLPAAHAIGCAAALAAFYGFGPNKGGAIGHSSAGKDLWVDGAAVSGYEPDRVKLAGQVTKARR